MNSHCTVQSSIPPTIGVVSTTGSAGKMWIWRNDTGRPATPGPCDFSRIPPSRKFSAPPELPPIKDALPNVTTRRRSQTLPFPIDGPQRSLVREGCDRMAPSNRLGPVRRPSTGQKRSSLQQKTQQRPLSSLKKCYSMQNLTIAKLADDGPEQNQVHQLSDCERPLDEAKLTRERLTSHKTKHNLEYPLTDAKKNMILRWLCDTEKKPVIYSSNETANYTLPQL